MANLPSSISLPRRGGAGLLALVGATALAVELLVPAPSPRRPVAKLSPIVSRPLQLDGDQLRLGCRAPLTAIEIARRVDPSRSVPAPIRSRCGGADPLPRALTYQPQSWPAFCSFNHADSGAK
jgi:hypothetical protein